MTDTIIRKKFYWVNVNFLEVTFSDMRLVIQNKKQQCH